MNVDMTNGEKEHDDNIDEQIRQTEKEVEKKKEKLKYLANLRIEEEIIDRKIRSALRDLQVGMNVE